MSFSSITDPFLHFLDGRKIDVGQTLPHALPVELEHRVPDECYGAVIIGSSQRKTDIFGHMLQAVDLVIGTPDEIDAGMIGNRYESFPTSFNNLD